MSTRCSCAFYAGYSLTQIAGGYLCARVPANRVLVAIVVTWSAATVATAAAGPSLGAARTPLLFALAELDVAIALTRRDVVEICRATPAEHGVVGGAGAAHIALRCSVSSAPRLAPP